MKEQLQSIIDQKVTGTEAVEILKSAIKERKLLSDQYSEFMQLIRNAEDTLIYGKEGRPVLETYR